MGETPLILANNLVLAATITGQTNPDARFSLDRLADLKRYTRWQSTDTVLKNLDFQIPAADQRPVTCLVIDKAHTLSGVACRFLYSDNGSAWTQLDTFTPASSGVIFRTYSGQTAHPYYRLELGASAELHRINQVWFGEAWQLEENPSEAYDADAKRFYYDDFDTESGIKIRVNHFEKGVVEFDLTLVGDDEYASLDQFFTDLSASFGFLWFVNKPASAPSKIMYMISDMEERRFASRRDALVRTGSLSFEEVLG